MSSVDLITSPSPVLTTTTTTRDRSPVIVVDSDDEEVRIPKRRRTSSDDSSSGSDDVIDLTAGDDAKADRNGHIRFEIIPKLLTPFRFSDDDGEEHDGVPLANLREHLRRMFGIGSSNNQQNQNYDNDGEDSVIEQPPSPINPDELEITGVKESNSNNNSNPSSLSSSSSSSNSSSSSRKPLQNNNNILNTKNNKTTTKEKDEKDGKDGKVTLECAICLGEMKNITATTCGHIFCKDCIRQAIQVTKCCPLCKKKLTLRSIHPIYL